MVGVPRADDRPSRTATLQLRWTPVRMPPPKSCRRRRTLAAVPVWAIKAVEQGAPHGERPICGLLVTTLACDTLRQAREALEFSRRRWRIERFPEVWKSGGPVEALERSSGARLANAAAVLAQVTVRVLRLMEQSRCVPEAATELL